MTVRWIAGLTLLAVAALIIAGNSFCIVRALRAGKGYSSVPFVAALLATIAVLVLPIRSRTWPLAAALVLDFTVPMALVALVRHGLGRTRRTHPSRPR